MPPPPHPDHPIGFYWTVVASEFPARAKRGSLSEFMDTSWKPLSDRALGGFLQRARSGSLRFAPGFIERLEAEMVRRARQGAAP